MGIIVERLQERLPQQFKESPNINRWLEIVGEEYEELQEVIDIMITDFNVDKVEGVVLDMFGKLLNAPIRTIGMSDTTYRNVLYAQILLNTYNGTIEPLLAFFTTIGATGITYRELGSATARIQYTNLDPSVFPPKLLLTSIKKGKHPFTLDLVYYTSTPFGFKGNPSACPFGTGTLGTK
jgi:hypothetical protein